MPRPFAVSLGDVAAAGVRLRPTDAVTIVRALVLQIANRTLPGVPSAHVIRLLPSGAVTVGGPVVATGDAVPRAAQLLADLLPGARRAGAEPTPLVKLIDRALHDATAFGSLEDFAAALAPFAAHDLKSAIVDVTARWADASTSPGTEESTTADEPAGDRPDSGASVSDIRRARRDTGLSLNEVSRKSRIPVSMLRQLEWGYLRNWPRGLYGRTQLARYARAAGLNRELVLEVMWPLVDEAQHADVPEMAANADADAPAKENVDAIVIMQPTFSANEVLFEVEGRAPRTPSEVVVEAPLPLEESDHLLAVRPMTSGDPGDAVAQVEAPRRSSRLGAAAALALATAGAVWGMRAGSPDESRFTTEIVRRLPAGTEPAARRRDSAVERGASAPVSRPQSSPAGSSRTVPAGGLRPIAAAAVIPPTVGARLVRNDEADDEISSTSPAFASAGGVVFAEPTQEAIGTSGGLGNGLGLRITHVVNDRGRNYHARPSPDGAHVAFDSDRDGERAVYVAEANGRNLRRVSGEGFAALPNWSPDGKTLSYVRAELDNPNVWNLWAVDLGSGQPRRLTSNTSGRPQGGSWFPDGRRIAYSRGGRLEVLDVNSGVASAFDSLPSGRRAGPPAVSPDGRWAMFRVVGDGAWLLDLTDGTSRKVLSDPTAADFTWSPDGSRVAYYSSRDQGWGVWVTVAR